MNLHLHIQFQKVPYARVILYRAFSTEQHDLSTGVRLDVLIAMKHGNSLKFNDDHMPTGRVVFGTFAKACEVAPPELSVEPTLIGTYQL